jgi:hypothetical protein
MKIELIVREKNGRLLYEGRHDITDAQSFGQAFADVWAKAQEQRLQKTTSIGDLMEILNDDVVEEMNGASIGIRRL